MRRSFTRLLALTLGMLVAACANNPPPTGALPQVSFAGKPPFVLNVAKIEIVPKITPSSQPPHIELTMPVSPENAIRRWVQDRIQAKGSTGILRVLINDATATETPLKMEKGMSAMFTTQQESRIDMSAAVTLQVLDERQFVKSEVTGNATRSRTLPQGLKLNERDKILYDMVVDMVTGLAGQVEPQIQTTFGPWLVMQ